MPQRNRIVWTEDSLAKGIKEFGPKLNLAVGALMKFQAPKVQNYARSNAPWTDRTGNARQGLFAIYTVDRGAFLPSAIAGATDSGSHVITLSHSVNYGVWLEIRWAGRYAIIVPTIQTEGARIMKALNHLMLKMRALPI